MTRKRGDSEVSPGQERSVDRNGPECDRSARGDEQFLGDVITELSRMEVRRKLLPQWR